MYSMGEKGWSLKNYPHLSVIMLSSSVVTQTNKYETQGVTEGDADELDETSDLLYLSEEKAMAPHSSTLAWKIPWVEEPGGLQSMGSLRVRHD